MSLLVLIPIMNTIIRSKGVLPPRRWRKGMIRFVGMLGHSNTEAHIYSWLVNTWGSANRAGPTQSNLLCTIGGNNVSVVCTKNMMGKTVWVISALDKGNPIHEITCWVKPQQCPYLTVTYECQNDIFVFSCWLLFQMPTKGIGYADLNSFDTVLK